MTRSQVERHACAESARLRWKLRVSEARAAVLAEVLAEYQQRELRARLRRWLIDPTDFAPDPDQPPVFDDAGRLDARRLELQVRDLLRRKPHLAAPGALDEHVGGSR